MPFEAVQYFSANPPGFVWYASIRGIVKGIDRYRSGRGNMLIKLFGLFGMADTRGAEVDQGVLIRYFSEMVWFPTAYLGENVRFEPVDADSFRVVLSDESRTVSAIFEIEEDGSLKRFVADRYMDIEGTYHLRKGSIFVDNYQEVDGIRVPFKGRAVWHLDSRDFEYINIEITDIEFNKPSLYQKR